MQTKTSRYTLRRIETRHVDLMSTDDVQLAADRLRDLRTRSRPGLPPERANTTYAVWDNVAGCWAALPK